MALLGASQYERALSLKRRVFLQRVCHYKRRSLYPGALGPLAQDFSLLKCVSFYVWDDEEGTLFTTTGSLAQDFRLLTG
eukprot:2247513-Amphidinium_carterae.1